MTVLRGGPGAGKTALALTYIQNAALVNAVPTAIFSPTLTGETVLLRLLAAESRIPLEQFTTRGLSPEQRGDVHTLWRKLTAAPLYINDSVEWSARKLRRSLLGQMEQAEVQLVVMATRKSGQARRFAAIAREFHVALLLAHRTSSPNGRYVHWEPYADRIIDLRRPDLGTNLDAVVLRNRYGRSGTAKLYLDPHHLGVCSLR